MLVIYDWTESKYYGGSRNITIKLFTEFPANKIDPLHARVGVSGGH